MTRNQAHRIPRTLGDEWDDAMDRPWHTAAQAVGLAFVFIVMVAAFIAAGLTSWGGMQ